jgi:prevent-host-death family protein
LKLATAKKKPLATLAIREAKARLSEAITLSQSACVLITKHGRPIAVLVGIAGLDLRDVLERFG